MKLISKQTYININNFDKIIPFGFPNYYNRLKEIFNLYKLNTYSLVINIFIDNISLDNCGINNMNQLYNLIISQKNIE